MSDSNRKEPGRLGDDGAAVIQVTPGQIVGAALFLLVAAAIIFVAGMFARGLTMSANEDELASAPAESSELDQGTDIPAPEPAEPDPEPSPSEPAEEPPPVEPVPEPEPEVVEEAPPVVDAEPVTAEAEESEPPMETAPPEPEPTPEPEPPAPQEPTPPPPGPEVQPLPEIPPSTTGPYTVQVMSIGIAKRVQAEAFQRDAHENRNVQMELVESADGKLLRAYVGSYANRADAETARDELLRAGFDGCFIKKRDE